MKLNKRLLALVVLFVVFALALSLAACNTTPDNPNPGGGGGDEDIDPVVTSLEVTTPPIKTYYLPGQSFDPTGMVLVAKWNDGEDEELGRGEYTIAPEVFADGDTAVTFTYEGVSLAYPVTVSSLSDVTVDSLEVNRDRLPEVCSAGYIDMSLLDVTAVYKAGDKPQQVTDYELFDNGQKAVLDNGTRYFLTEGEHELTVEYGQKQFSFNIDCPYTLIEAEYHNGLGNFTDSKNYAEWKPADSSRSFSEAGLGLWGYSSWGIDVPSGEIAVNGIGNGDTIAFHMWSTEEVDRMLKLSCASHVRIALNDSWGPDKTADVQFNKVFKLFVNKEEVSVSDDVVVQGRTRTGKMERYALDIWVQLVDIAMVHLKQGDNLIEFTNIGERYLTTEGQNVGTPLTATLNFDCIQFGDAPVNVEPAEENNFRIGRVDIVKIDNRAMLKISGSINGITADDVKVGVHCLYNNWPLVELPFTLTIDKHNMFVVLADITDLKTLGESLFCMWRISDEEANPDMSADDKHIQVISNGKVTIDDRIYYASRPYDNLCGMTVTENAVFGKSFATTSSEIKNDGADKAVLEVKGTIEGYTKDDVKMYAYAVFGDWHYIELSFEMTVDGTNFVAVADITSLNGEGNAEAEYIFYMPIGGAEPGNSNVITAIPTGVAVVGNVTYTASQPYSNPCGMKVTVSGDPQPPVTEVTVDSIEVTHAPDKTEYKVGDEFDPTGMVVVAHMSDGKQKTLTAEEYTISPSILAKDTAQVTISYQGKTATVDVTVSVVEEPTNAYTVSEATIKNDGDDKAVLELKGTIEGYTKDDIRFSVLAMNTYTYSVLNVEWTIESKNYVAKIDITDLNVAGEYIFYMHLATEAAGDSNRIETGDTGEAKVGDVVYTASKPYDFPCGMRVTVKKVNVATAEIKADGDNKVVLELSGTLGGVAKDDIHVYVYVLIGDWHYVELTCIITVDGDNFVLVADLTSLTEIGEYIFYMPLGDAAAGDANKITTKASGKVTVNGITYEASEPFGNPCGMKTTAAE